MRLSAAKDFRLAGRFPRRCGKNLPPEPRATMPAATRLTRSWPGQAGID
jgi:hypothetical protein